MQYEKLNVMEQMHLTQEDLEAIYAGIRKDEPEMPPRPEYPDWRQALDGKIALLVYRIPPTGRKPTPAEASQWISHSPADLILFADKSALDGVVMHSGDAVHVVNTADHRHFGFVPEVNPGRDLLVLQLDSALLTDEQYQQFQEFNQECLDHILATQSPRAVLQENNNKINAIQQHHDKLQQVRAQLETVYTHWVGMRDGLREKGVQLGDEAQNFVASIWLAPPALEVWPDYVAWREQQDLNSDTE